MKYKVKVKANNGVREKGYLTYESIKYQTKGLREVSIGLGPLILDFIRCIPSLKDGLMKGKTLEMSVKLR